MNKSPSGPAATTSGIKVVKNKEMCHEEEENAQRLSETDDDSQMFVTQNSQVFPPPPRNPGGTLENLLQAVEVATMEDDSEVIPPSQETFTPSQKEHLSLQNVNTKGRRGRPRHGDIVDYDFSDDQIENLVGFIKRNPILYDKKLPQWSNISQRNLLWEECAKEFPNCMGSQCKKLYEKKRTSIGKLHAKKFKSGASAASVRLTYKEEELVREWGFLLDHVSHQGTLSNEARDQSSRQSTPTGTRVQQNEDEYLSDHSNMSAVSTKRRRSPEPEMENVSRVLSRLSTIIHDNENKSNLSPREQFRNATLDMLRTALQLQHEDQEIRCLWKIQKVVHDMIAPEPPSVPPSVPQQQQQQPQYRNWQQPSTSPAPTRPTPPPPPPPPPHQPTSTQASAHHPSQEFMPVQPPYYTTTTTAYNFPNTATTSLNYSGPLTPLLHNLDLPSTPSPGPMPSRTESSINTPHK